MTTRKMILNKEDMGVHWTELALDSPVASSFENSNKFYSGKFFDQLIDYQFLKGDSSLWSYIEIVLLNSGKGPFSLNEKS
jgi:hypothetical protein